ncbi:thioredoxin domain-containing protein [Microcoleus sp. FACHB-1515]|uniref:thioredoxin domain-containing protein n=1 Tax=Cyanophyceae TaxID=3028117 RepID=UPI001685ABFB|nr:thioredoxin domain-containing protein [Microcoleus sp. FACHB-1515]MBD2090107.1 thioredoxin domain-containing protein [Microcoleus sp. FACHB-1515]
MSNRLAAAQSLYLRKHAENPIDWWEWSDEAIATARRDNKPIFLSIGYSSCHWCTVMEGEAFSDPTIAAFMNANFLPIKVDREERPDLDSIYMQALQLLTGQGGWPLNVFLSPDDLLPFYGGTYFPIDPRYGRPGFLQVLEALCRFFHAERDKLRSIKDEVMSALQETTQAREARSIDVDLLKLGLEYSAGILAAKGMGPSFPMIPHAAAALAGSRFRFDRYDAMAAAKQRGLDLALGGIFDHVGGGFHRYTVDATWTVPHFEKMLYDNGQIVEFLANLWSAGVQEAAIDRAIDRTVEWLEREMTAPEGYFYAAQDADSFTTPSEAEPEEGAFYVWRYEELLNLLTSEEFSELSAAFAIAPAGNFEGQIVLQRRESNQLSQTAEAAIAKLFAVRYGAIPDRTVMPARNNEEAKTTAWSGRIPPVTDTKMILAWNSLMISGLARSSAVLNRPHHLELASRAAAFLLDNQSIDRQLHRLNYNGQASILAQSEDYALFIKALLDLDQAALGEGKWLESAVQLQQEFDDRLGSSEGGYFNTIARSDLVIRERSTDDNATPSANGIAIANLIRLSLRTENLAYLDAAERALRAFSGIMGSAPQSCPVLFLALDWYLFPILVRSTGDRITELQQHYFPTATFAIESELPAGAIGLVCEGLSCQEPAQSWEQLQQQLQQSQTVHKS